MTLGYTLCVFIPEVDFNPDPTERGNRMRLSVLFMSVWVLAVPIKALIPHCADPHEQWLHVVCVCMCVCLSFRNTYSSLLQGSMNVELQQPYIPNLNKFSHPRIINLLETLCQGTFPTFQRQTLSQVGFLSKLHYQLSKCPMQLGEKHLATSSFASFLGEWSNTPPFLNHRFFGNRIMVVCQLSLNQPYHQTGLKIK